MRGNAWQVTAIIAILLVIVLLVPLVLMGRGWQTLSDRANQAEKNQNDTAQKAATLEREVDALKTLLGKPDVAALDDVLTLYTETMKEVRPGENDSTRTYHGTLTALLGDLKNMRKELCNEKADKCQLYSDYENARKSYEDLISQEKANLRRVEAARAAEQNQYIRARDDYKQELNEANRQQRGTLDQLERTKYELTDRANQLEFANRDIRETNTYLAGMLEDIRNPNVEYPAGKIISVNQQAGAAIINLGSADGLMVRTMFSVYHSSVAGLTFRTVPAGREAVYCDVCRREISRDVSKASVEVMQILGAHKAEVRILDDILTDPIMAGDVIYSPIWKPGQKWRFALTAGMHLPGTSLDSGTEAVIHLIESNGGVVDCWIDETAEEGENCLKGTLSDLTNFVVIHEATARGLEPEVALVQEGLLESARNRAIKIISLDDLLSRMGWKNTTPVYVFGSEEFMPAEMRVIPQRQESVRYSDNKVSPLFTPDNPNARVNARDIPARSSGGVVSPLYNEQAPPPPVSSGRTSDLFRPRSPQTGRE